MLGESRRSIALTASHVSQLPKPRHGWSSKYLTAVVAVDLVAAVCAAVASYLIRFALAENMVVLLCSLAMPVAWVLALCLSGAYERVVLGTGPEEFTRLLHAAVGLTALIAFVSYATKAEVARGYVVLAIPLALVASATGRLVARKVLHVVRHQGRAMTDLVALGGAGSVLDLAHQLRRERYCGLRVIAACVPSDQLGAGSPLDGQGVPVLADLADFEAVVATIRASGAAAVAVMSSAAMPPSQLRRLAWELEGTGIELMVSPGLMEIAGPRLHIRPITGLPLLQVEQPEFTGAGRLIKQTVDRVAALGVLVVLSPLLLTIALLVRVTTHGPAFFLQTRIGKDGNEFRMIKFRTMVTDAEQRLTEVAVLNERAEGLLFKARRDPRVTPIGRVLRKYSLDELPQLINVLLGTMSMVGPRPPLPSEVAQYSADVRRRLLVKPGMTGLWQISGRSDLTWDESVRLDLRYVENWSLMFDVLIVWKTLGAVTRGAGAY